VIAQAGRSLVVLVVCAVAFGFAYSLLVTGVGAVAFPHQAAGSLVQRNRQTVGSSLAAQPITAPRYFHERLSAVDYNAAGTSFANLGPTSPDLVKQIHDAAQAILKLEGPYKPGLAIHDIPVDAVTTSASGIDPDISPAYAQLQARRVAAVRHLPLGRVEALIRAHTAGRFAGLFGESAVNVLALDLALDKEH
jgi:K+-transporting ATPase ATPase C chain